MNNFIFKVNDGHKIGNGADQSVQTYDCFNDAYLASELDTKAYRLCDTAIEAQENSPVDWEWRLSKISLNANWRNFTI